MTTAAPTPTFLLSALRCAAAHARPEECAYRVARPAGAGQAPSQPRLRVRAVQIERADEQHRLLRTTLSALGARVVELPFVHGAYDSVFARDVALVVEARGRLRALLARPHHEQRRCERAARARTFAELGLEVVDEDHEKWEGGDVVMAPDGRSAFFGHGLHSSRAALGWLERQLDVPLVPLRLVSEHVHHLDMALAVLPDGTRLVCEQALDAASVRALRAQSGGGGGGGGEVVPVAIEDAIGLGLSTIQVGDVVVTGDNVPAIERALLRHGMRPVVVDLSEFHLAGRGAACLAMRVHRQQPHAAATEGWALAGAC